MDYKLKIVLNICKMSYIEELCSPSLIFEHSKEETSLMNLLGYLKKRQIGQTSPIKIGQDFEKFYKSKSDKVSVDDLIDLLQKKSEEIQIIRV